MAPVRGVQKAITLPPGVGFVFPESWEEDHGEWLERARATAFELGRQQEIVTVDDVRALCPPPPRANPKIMAAVLDRKNWVCVGYRKSTRKECHQRPIGEFKLK